MNDALCAVHYPWDEFGLSATLLHDVTIFTVLMIDSFQNEFFMYRIDLATGDSSVIREEVAGPIHWIKPCSSIVVYLPFYSIILRY